MERERVVIIMFSQASTNVILLLIICSLEKNCKIFEARTINDVAFNGLGLLVHVVDSGLRGCGFDFSFH